MLFIFQNICTSPGIVQTRITRILGPNEGINKIFSLAELKLRNIFRGREGQIIMLLFVTVRGREFLIKKFLTKLRALNLTVANFQYFENSAFDIKRFPTPTNWLDDDS